ARDFDNERLAEHVAYLRRLATEVAAAEPRCSIQVEDYVQYRNTFGTLSQRPEIVANLEEAIRRVGLEPRQTAIRGGTDGSALSEMGLPTANVLTGGQGSPSDSAWVSSDDVG